jgi:hypothetical protein
MNEEPSEVWRMIGLAMAYYATRHVHAADQEVASLIEKYGMDAAYNIAYVYAFRNQRDEAFAWLEKVQTPLFTPCSRSFTDTGAGFRFSRVSACRRKLWTR